VIRVSENGDILEEFSVLQVLLDNSPGWFFGNATFGIPNADFFHLNDVEELTSTMAKSFPQFETGDLLLSLRGLSMLMIVDPHTRRIKWTQVGRWLRQHDPDFQTTGLISLFNNNTFDGAPHLNATAFSSILELDPRTGATTVRYSGAPGKPMYTEFRGHHQYLDNGNVLITESNSGRVLEVDREGTVVWEFINRYDDRQAAVIYQARRYPEHHFAVQDWSCPN
jgi:hypothetical protein